MNQQGGTGMTAHMVGYPFFDTTQSGQLSKLLIHFRVTRQSGKTSDIRIAVKNAQCPAFKQQMQRQTDFHPCLDGFEELIGVATSEKDGLMPSIQRMTTSYQKDQQKYCKIAEFRNRLTGISMLISVFKNHENSSPSVVLLTGYSDDLSVNSIKRGIYLTNVYYQKKENKTIVYVKSSAYVYISTLCIGMNGSLKLSHENNLDLPSDAIEIPIS